MLAGLRTVLEASGAVRVVGEAGDGAALLVAVDAHRPDVVLVDVQMPGTDGLSALRLLCARPAAEQLRGVAKRALAEMRAALSLLAGIAEPVQGLAEIAAPVEGAQAAGVEVEVESARSGEPTELPPGVGRAVYRVVQESLTDAVRHTPGAPVRIEPRRHPDELVVRVTNPAPPRPRRRREAFAVGGAGLSERVASPGGSLAAGPVTDGGFAVRATFPSCSRPTS